MSINFKREINDSFDHAIERATKALAAEGFGILTRIDGMVEAVVDLAFEIDAHGLLLPEGV